MSGYSPAAREFFKVMTGAELPTGDANGGYRSSLEFDLLRDSVRGLSTDFIGAMSVAAASMPEKIGSQFIAALKNFVDDGGENHLAKFGDELDKISRKRVNSSINMREAEYQVILEFASMMAEIAFILAVAPLTGGTSLTEIALLRSRSALSMLLTVQRLTRGLGIPIAGGLEALQEAFQTFASQLLAMTVPSDPGARRKSIGWGEIGDAALFGMFAGIYGGAFKEVASKFVKDHLKDKPPIFRELLEIPGEGVNEGAAETFAVATVNALKGVGGGLSLETFLGAAVSGMIYAAGTDSAEYFGKSLHEKFRSDLSFPNPNARNTEVGGNGHSAGEPTSEPDAGPGPGPGTGTGTGVGVGVGVGQSVDLDVPGALPFSQVPTSPTPTAPHNGSAASVPQHSGPDVPTASPDLAPVSRPGSVDAEAFDADPLPAGPFDVREQSIPAGRGPAGGTTSAQLGVDDIPQTSNADESGDFVDDGYVTGSESDEFAPGTGIPAVTSTPTPSLPDLPRITSTVPEYDTGAGADADVYARINPDVYADLDADVLAGPDMSEAPYSPVSPLTADETTSQPDHTSSGTPLSSSAHTTVAQDADADTHVTDAGPASIGALPGSESDTVFDTLTPTVPAASGTADDPVASSDLGTAPLWAAPTTGTPTTGPVTSGSSATAGSGTVPASTTPGGLPSGPASPAASSVQGVSQVQSKADAPLEDQPGSPQRTVSSGVRSSDVSTDVSSDVSVPLATSLDVDGDADLVAARADAVVVGREHVWVDPVSVPVGPDGGRTQYVVRSAFDVRRFEVGGGPVTDVTVRVAFVDAEGGVSRESDGVWERLRSGMEEVFNTPRHRLPGGDRLHVTVERAGEGEGAHWVLELFAPGPERVLSHHALPWDVSGRVLAHELGHQLGLRDESPEGEVAEHRPAVVGSLMGDFNKSVPAGSGLAEGGLRERHLALLAAVIGDVGPVSAPGSVRGETAQEGAGSSAHAFPLMSGQSPVLGADPQAPQSTQPTASVSQPSAPLAGNAAATRELENARDVENFLRQYNVAVVLVYSSRHNMSPLRAASHTGFRLGSVIDGMLADGEVRGYEDSENGAKRLAEAICDKIGVPPEESIEEFSQSSPAISEMSLYDIAPVLLQRFSTVEPSVGRSVEPPIVDAGPARLADTVSQKVRPEFAKYTPENSLSSGVMEGVSGAFTGRVEAITRAPQSPENTVEMMRWGLWGADSGLENMSSIVEELAKRASPEEGERLRRDFDVMKSEAVKKAAASTAASLTTGAAIGQAASVFPHPVVSAAGRIASMVTGGIAAHNKIADNYETIKDFQKKNPAVFDAIERQRDKDLRAQAAANSETIRNVWANSEWG